MSLLCAFRFENDDDATHSPVGWPGIEAIVIGLFKYYQVEIRDDIAAYFRADFEGDGGAVLDLPGADDPFKNVEVKVR
jgi:hypothetical protein